MNRLVTLAATALVAALAVAESRAVFDPHRFLSDRRHCLDCHVSTPRKGQNRGQLRFTKDIVSLCLGCHREKDVSALHPVDIRPAAGRAVAGLPLDERGAITCATCHNPHAPAEDGRPYVAQPLYQRLLSVLNRKEKFRTFYLRRRNDEGQLCLSCHDRSLMAAEAFHAKEASVLDQYVGSETCGRCHDRAYRRWRLTPHARVLRDARRDPAALAADFGRGAPFPREQVVYVLGAHWTQRYVVDKGGRLFVKGAAWSLSAGKWDTSSTLDKPWAEYCQGCHVTGFEMKDSPRHAELGVGCEACHGPGRSHVEAQGRGPIVNPADLDPVRRDMICESCHTTGHDPSGQFRFPVGYRPGRDLTRFFKGLLPKPGQDNASFLGDETYSDRHRQWLFWAGTVLDARDQACEVCRDFRNQQQKPREKKRMTHSEYCLSCHRPSMPKDDRHRRHEGRGVACTQCHSPGVGRNGRSYDIHDHKFLFERPEAPAAAGAGDGCRRCHRKPVVWAG